MADKIDDILASGCLEKLIESDKEITTVVELTTFLSENGFNDVSDEDKKAIVEEVKALESATGGGSGVKNKSNVKNVKAKQSCTVNIF